MIDTKRSNGTTYYTSSSHDVMAILRYAMATLMLQHQVTYTDSAITISVASGHEVAIINYINQYAQRAQLVGTLLSTERDLYARTATGNGN